MKKYLLLMAAGIFGILTANAYTVTDKGNGVIEIDGGACDSTIWTDGYNIAHKEYFGKNGNTGIPASFTAEDKAKLANATKIVIKGYVETMDAFQENSWNNWPKVTSVDMSEAHFKQDRTVVETPTFQLYDPKADPKFQTVTRTYMQNVMNFSFFKSMTEAKLSRYVESISAKAKCFDGNAALTTTFEIPASVKYIAQHACDNTPISRITIPSTVEYIATQAFQNDKIDALIDVTVEGYTFAARGAFDKEITVGQTKAEGKTYATLHFPEGAEDFFQNQEHRLPQGTSLDKGAFQTWLDNHYTAAGTCSNPNGWKEFINSGSGTPETAKGVVLRTYSDKYARLVPVNFRAYVVSGIHDDTNGNYVLDLVQIFAIPANTGVILYGEVANTENSYTLTRITSWDKGGIDYVKPYTRFTPAQTPAGDVSPKNYMVPTVENTIIYPYYKGMTDANWESIWDNAPTTMANYYNASGSVTDRSFIMTKLSSTSFASKVVADEVESVPDGKSHNYVGFFRTKPALVCGPNKAYLCLPNTVLNDPQSFEGVVVKPTGTEMAFRSAEWNNKVSTGNWGPRELTDPLKSKVAGDVEEVSGISNVSAEVVEDDSYYTLQGVKVAQPNKGIYIKNGKKIIIK